MSGFVYIWRDRKHNRFYIGSHWGSETDGYICSSTWMRNAYNRRREDFRRRVLSRITESRAQLLLKEYEWLTLIPSEQLGKRYYNLRQHQFSHWMAKVDASETIKDRISKKTKEAMARPEVREKYLEGLKTRINRSSDPGVKEKMSKSNKGKNTGKDNSKARLASANSRRGVALSDAHRTKIKATTHFTELNKAVGKCAHCEFVGNTGNLARYHNEKCKHRNE